ncbi:response regulator [Leptolyngbya sp. FACHB-17]|uniref:hybrid sensor histidine kinase/response regulator n=1 Tax=unclassified Leptolyngbya TaxID=2650499 RepID=UPI00168044D6|nr:response regulator [Leptolyngbya sp. FACHB-17]MBD2078341.1 response regulator [Leptolyngbya sp. FACHB-17]
MSHSIATVSSPKTDIYMGRSSQQIKAEIEATLGFIPPFFEPAEPSPQVLENLWQQTLAAYIHNPLPALFKEKLSAYLSRFCVVPYCMICHSCTLRPLGLSAREVLALLDSPPPVLAALDEHLEKLATQPRPLEDWSNLTPSAEASLLQVAIFIALESEQAKTYRDTLQQFLGVVNYKHLLAFIAYVKACHAWMELHPEVVYEADQRVQSNLNVLLEEEPNLANFFGNYQERVKLERQSRAEQLAELAKQQWREKILRQQVDRERVMTEIAQRIRGSLDLKEILRTAVTEVQQFLQVDRVFIYRFASDWSGEVTVEAVVPGCLPIQGRRVMDSFFIQPGNRALYQQGRIHAVSDIRAGNLSQCHLELLDCLQIRANLVVPIVQDEQLWGLLVANDCTQVRPWQSIELELLKQLSTQLAIAIQQAQLHQQVQTELMERQRSEEKIREQAALLDVTTDAIWVLDSNYQILFWNRGAEQLYGWLKAEASSLRANDLLCQKVAPTLEKIQKTVLEAGKWQGELHQLTKDGKEILVESCWTAMFEADQLKSILVINTDITQKKQLERQFLHAQRLESLGTLAGGIAHDLNNILTPILAVSQLLQLKLTDADESTRQFLKIQETNTKRGAALINQILSFARGAESKRRALQVRYVIAEIKQIIDGTFPKSIEVSTQIDTDLQVVSADTTQLHQVLMNLCVNARDAMPAGGCLSVSAQNLWIDESYAHMHLDAKVGPYIVISVADTGSGISPDAIDHIFDPFFTTKEVGKGTGLGLSTVNSIIRSHGGFINVYSEVGQGTQFKVHLPAIAGRETQSIREIEQPLGNGELILVVDDEGSICEITKTTLETSGYKVLTANDGIEALASYAQHKDKVDIVLMDMMMPNMTGPAAIQILKKMNPLVKVVAVSGLPSSDNVKEAMHLGASAFLSKPYTAQELLKALHKVMHAVGQPSEQESSWTDAMPISPF